MSPEILLTPRFYPSFIHPLKILVNFCCGRTFSNFILLPFRGSRIYGIHILILLKGSRIFLKSGYSLENIPILLDYMQHPYMWLQHQYMWLQHQYMWLQHGHICGCSTNICGCSTGKVPNHLSRRF